MVRLGWLGTIVQTQHDDFDDVEGRGAIPIVHDQDITIAETRLAVDIGLTRRFGASLMLPVRVVSTRVRYLDGGGTEVDLVTPSTHHRNETLSGIADPMVLGALQLSPVTVRFGASLPLGRIEDDPFAMPDMTHQHIQLGTGTINPVLAIEGGYGWDRWRASAFAFTQQVIYTNDRGYKAGDRYAAGVALRRALRHWTVRGGVEMQAETYEAWNGTRYTDEGNQGRIDAMFAAGTTWSVTPELTVDLGLKVPFINHVVGGQLRVPALLEIGASYAFGKRARREHEHEHEDEHDHDHDHDHDGLAHDDHDGHAKPAALDTSGADIADLGHAGARVDLVPVPGKLTIFDFWAEWCVPCKTLEPVLVEIAKANPTGVALRRIDVVDWESQVVAQHLTPNGFDLPHVKIYDAHGALVYEESSGPGKLKTMISTIRTVAGAPVPSETPAPTTTAASIEVTERGFEPANVDVPHGVPVTLTFHRRIAKTCATEVVMKVDGKQVRKVLPLDQSVEVTLTFPTAGVIPYACDMDMIGGTITVR